MWRKRQTRAKLAPNVHHNEQNPSDLVNILTNSSIKSEQKHDNLSNPLDLLHEENVRLGLYEGVYDLSIKSKKIEEDDDIQVYKKPWIGLTEEDIKLFDLGNYIYVVRIVEARLKELNA
jgi:hypothetical protein